MSISSRRLFKSVIPNFEEFIKLINSEIGDSDLEAFHYYLYKRIERRFSNQEIAFTNDYDFLGEFLNVYEDNYRRIFKLKEFIEEMQRNGLEDINSSYSVSSVAYNPNNKITLPDEILGYINSQNYSKDVMKKNEALYRAIVIMPKNVINVFLQEFRPLFITVFNDDYSKYLY